MNGSVSTISAIYSFSNLFGQSKRMVFHCGLGYSKANIASSNYEIEHKNVIIPVYFSYRFWTNKVSPFVRAGIKNYFTVDQMVFDKKSDRESEISELRGAYQIAGQIGFGLQFEHGRILCSFAAIREHRSTITKVVTVSNNYLSTKISGSGLNFGIRLTL